MSRLAPTNVPAAALRAASRPGDGLWALAWRRLRRNRTAMSALAVVLAFLLMIASTRGGGLAQDWNLQAGVSFAPPTVLAAGAVPAKASVSAAVLDPRAPVEMYGVVDPLAAELARARSADPTATMPARAATLLLGGDKWGRSVALKVIKGAETSVGVGLAAAVLATLLGTLLGALAGYLGGWIDALFDWVYGVVTAIPYLLLVFAIAAVLQQKGVTTIVLILGLTGWTGVYRLIRAEYLKHKGREYVLAAQAIGASQLRRMFVHILPNVSHVVLVQLSQLTVDFIKAEVILSFLGFGVPVDVVSWGSILNEAPNELILGKWWQLAVAGSTMAVLVTAFAMLTDGLRDALDPRLK